MTHYTCDRCGADLSRAVRPRWADVVIDWPDRPLSDDKDTIVLTWSVLRPYVEMSPDLCDDCHAHILREAASMLDTDREPAEVQS
jgi:hypothetical protein